MSRDAITKNEKEVINVFFTINDSYAKYLSVTMASIILNTKRNIHFYIIDSNISEESKRRLEELKNIHQFEIEYLPINKDLFNRIPQSSQKHISMETNYRFLISSIKSKMDKCIFIDADLVFDGDIGKLWDVDVSDYYMAAVTDQAPLKAGSWVEKLPLPQGYVYCNTGVTVMNLKKWREDNIEEKLFENVAKYAALLKFPDQDTLNITLALKVKYLPHIFNAMPVQHYFNKEQEKEAFTSPIVVHWAGCRKPWLNPSVTMGDVFWKYAKQSPFFIDVIYNNLQQNIILKDRIIADSLQLAKLKVKYIKYKILSKITFGKKRKKYKQKREDLKIRIKSVKKFIKG